MFNDEAFSKMKKGARIVNVARGGVIDEAALARALDNGQVAQVPMLSLYANVMLLRSLLLSTHPFLPVWLRHLV